MPRWQQGMSLVPRMASLSDTIPWIRISTQLNLIKSLKRNSNSTSRKRNLKCSSSNIQMGHCYRRKMKKLWMDFFRSRQMQRATTKTQTRPTQILSQMHLVKKPETKTKIKKWETKFKKRHTKSRKNQRHDKSEIRQSNLKKQQTKLNTRQNELKPRQTELRTRQTKLKK